MVGQEPTATRAQAEQQLEVAAGPRSQHDARGAVARRGLDGRRNPGGQLAHPRVRATQPSTSSAPRGMASLRIRRVARDQHVVLDAHADALLGQIQPGLDRHHAPGLERTLRIARVVRVEAQVVSDPVREVLPAEAGGGDDLVRAACTSPKSAPGRQAAIAACCACSTTSYTSRWRAENLPLTGACA